jgi:hypothetical protein
MLKRACVHARTQTHAAQSPTHPSTHTHTQLTHPHTFVSKVANTYQADEGRERKKRKRERREGGEGERDREEEEESGRERVNDKEKQRRLQKKSLTKHGGGSESSITEENSLKALLPCRQSTK